MFEDLLRTFRIADAFDIAFVSLLLYALFVWFKATASRPILVGMGVLVVVYFAARALDMYMTAGLFQLGLAFAAIAAIVVFQEDLRRAFARIASLGKLPRLRHPDRSAAHTDVIIETAFDLAQKKVGALIALRGVEPLDRHIQGGVHVDALISKPLLDSLFDPHSMGHDGAVIVQRDRIRQFAAHLPLSQNLEQIGGRGTRHSAALGLSEVTDAQIIVVSEERGQVSVAESGKLQTVETAPELKRHVERFANRTHPSKPMDTRFGILKEHAGLKVASLVLACVAWYLVSFEAETVQKTFVVPIEYRKLPENLVIDDTAPTEARVTLSGFERAFNLLVPTTVKVSLDLSGVEEGQQEIVVQESHINAPSGLTLFRSAPRVVSFGIHRWVPVQMPVEARTQGRLPDDLRLREIAVSPGAVRVLIWHSRRSWIKAIQTEPIDLGRITETVELKVKIALPQHVKLEGEQAPEVNVKVDVVSANAPQTAPAQQP